MLNLLKKWTLVVAALGGTMFASGCLGGKSWLWITAYLNEDLFG